jgi:hypothetical protein
LTANRNRFLEQILDQFEQFITAHTKPTENFNPKKNASQYANVIGIPPALAEALEHSRTERHELSLAKSFGKYAYIQATWIPCDR